MLDFQLSPQQVKLQKKARKFALKEILPVAWYYDEIDETPMKVLKKAHAAGLINGDIPKKYGGKGWGLIESVILTEELAAACPGLATTIFDNSLGMEPLEDLPIHREMDPTKVEGKEGETAWRCRICGYVHYAEEPPEECPYCFFPESAFKKVS